MPTSPAGKGVRPAAASIRSCCDVSAEGRVGEAGGTLRQTWRCELCMLLVVYAPRRQTVEVWQAEQGARLLALTGVGPHCQLLSAYQAASVEAGVEAGMGASQPAKRCGSESERSRSCLAGGPLGCYLFDGAQGAITDLAPLVKGGVTGGV